MSATYDLFLRWKDRKGFKSDRQAALALGISAQAVNVWKDGRNSAVIRGKPKGFGQHHSVIE